MLYFVKTFLLKEKLMADKYRVICTENQRLYPGKTFIDIYPAGSLRPENSLTHDCLLQMRRLATPEVDKLESGIILTDFGNGSIHLQYETMPNRRMKEYQNLLRQRLDKQIIDTFKQMRAKGFDRTLEISFTEMAARFDLYASEDDTPVSARLKICRQPRNFAGLASGQISRRLNKQKTIIRNFDDVIANSKKSKTQRKIRKRTCLRISKKLDSDHSKVISPLLNR